jgi:oxygen-independent coproporphyrinogen III oxidase
MEKTESKKATWLPLSSSARIGPDSSELKHPQSIIGNPKFEIENPQSAILNFRSEVYNSQSAIRNPQLNLPGLYIHIPFCKTKCGYCDFYSVTGASKIPDFIKALLHEMEMYRGKFHSFDTVYVGGGTPSVLSVGQLEALLEGARERFSLLPETEVTLEANPGDLHPAFLEALRRTGINRLNIGVQSFDEKVLQFLGRRHSAGEAASTFRHAREAGFENIGLDLIYGIPGQDMTSWMRTLDQVLAFSPEHLSCYQLTLEPRTPLGRRHEKGEWELPGEELQFDFFMKTAERLEAGGYTQYEVSNFAKGTLFLSRHNQKYWDHTPYLGLGPAAHSFLDNRRWWNHRSLDRYMADLNTGKPPVAETESLTTDQLRLEALFLGLRTSRGIDLQRFHNTFQYDLVAEQKEVLPRLQEEGFVLLQDGYLIPTRAGLAVADRLALM